MGSRYKIIRIVRLRGQSNIVGLMLIRRGLMLIRKGRALPFMQPEPACGVSYARVRKEIKALLRLWHKQWWDEIPVQGHSKFILGSIATNKTSLCLNLKRKELWQLPDIFIGSCHLNNHIHILRSKQNSTWLGCGEEEESPLHLLCHCKGSRKVNRERI